MRIPLCILFIGIISLAVGISSARFTATVAVTGNTIASGSWAPTPSPTPDVPAVVINEVMWMGSSSSAADQWIELYNTTNNPIDIGDWSIDSAFSSGGTLVVSSGVIPAQGYFLIARYPNGGVGDNSSLSVSPDLVQTSLNLSNSGNGHLVLRDADGAVVDRAKGDAWPAGVREGADGVRQSMQRVSPAADGLLGGSWQTCLDSACQSTSYWKTAEGLDYGTPKAANVIH